jgi:16S rRNA (adenine1518-N6/adenine1519-N6)-dimethyltransferase
MPLYRPSELRSLIEQLGTRAKKSLSQNFLIDGNILRKILEVSQVAPGDGVLEIGPGPGALTEALLLSGCTVVAVEKDSMFIEHLKTLPGRLTLHHADILSCSIQELLPAQKTKVIANLPYQITTPILQKLLPMKEHLSSLTLMVQKEVGERLVAEVGTPAYSSLTLFAQYYAKAQLCFIVKPSCFYPAPKVESCVVRFDLHAKSPSILPELFFAITRTAFCQRRKMLRRSLQSLFPAPQIEKALESLNLSLEARPEQLSFEEFEALAHRLYTAEKKEE